MNDDAPSQRVARIALPVPLDKLFDYTTPTTLARGTRVRVSFSGRKLIGVVIECTATSDHPGVLKPVAEVLDATPLISPPILDLIRWTAGYYHHPLGEAITLALPPALRRGAGRRDQLVESWQVCPDFDQATLSRAPRQAEALAAIAPHPAVFTLADAQASGITRQTLKALQDRAAVCRIELPPEQLPAIRPQAPRPTLTDEQQATLDQIDLSGGFQVHVLDGITGSGKTEVYLRAIASVLEGGGQALVLVPEIGLTPQTSARFAARFNHVEGYHSGLSDGARAQAWYAAAEGRARVMIGTRSATFVPLPQLRLIIIDEEHDASFKQQDGLRYSARDLLVKRAQNENIPIILGSATPSLETLQRARAGSWHHLRLTHRPGGAEPPRAQLIDLRGVHVDAGLSRNLLRAIRTELEADNQVLVYLNRRGFAPVLHCPACGWIAECKHCSVRLTMHRRPPIMRCHHCDHREPVPTACPDCADTALEPVGTGTQRLEQALVDAIPEFEILRIDRDATRSLNAMQRVLERIADGGPLVLLGTQMLAKGHHFPNVTLVAIVNIDGGLFSTDYRGAERMVQSVIQVSGRAGRAERPGRVLFQTWHPDHPLIKHLLDADYAEFATVTLQERQTAGLPPFARLALLRAEANSPAPAIALLDQLNKLPRDRTVDAFGPIAAPLERIMGMHRFQLLLRSHNRPALHHTLHTMAAWLRDQAPRQCRWSIDVDPQDLL